MNLTKSQISTLIRAIYNGKINPLKLPKNLYNTIADNLIKGVVKGFGGDVAAFEFGTPDYEMIVQLRENVYIFSAAKTFNYVLATENLIVENNEVLPFREFKKRALEVYKQYNEHWLEAEYNTAIGQAQSARAWVDFESNDDAMQLLKYQTVHDANVSEVCRQLDGIVKPVKDPFWNTYAPLNHYNCRCILQAVAHGVETPTPDGLTKPDAVFSSNPGKTGDVFNPGHPYFDVPQKYRKFAKENFNLPLPDEDTE